MGYECWGVPFSEAASHLGPNSRQNVLVISGLLLASISCSMQICAMPHFHELVSQRASISVPQRDKRIQLQPGLVTDTYAPLTQEAEDDQEFKAILSFIESSRAA